MQIEASEDDDGDHRVKRKGFFFSSGWNEDMNMVRLAQEEFRKKNIWMQS